MDQDLVTRAQTGDHVAFEALTVASHSRLYRAAHGILRDRHLAEDATQQAFIDIWQNIRRLRDASKFEGLTTVRSWTVTSWNEASSIYRWTIAPSSSSTTCWT